MKIFALGCIFAFGSNALNLREPHHNLDYSGITDYQGNNW